MSQAINADLLPQISGFDYGRVHVGFVVDEVALGHLFLPVIRFSPVDIIPPMIHNHFRLSTALVRRTNACSLGTSQKQGATVGRRVVSAVGSA
jgi:hypothetical protein